MSEVTKLLEQKLYIPGFRYGFTEEDTPKDCNPDNIYFVARYFVDLLSRGIELSPSSSLKWSFINDEDDVLTEKDFIQSEKELEKQDLTDAKKHALAFFKELHATLRDRGVDIAFRGHCLLRPAPPLDIVVPKNWDGNDVGYVLPKAELLSASFAAGGLALAELYTAQYTMADKYFVFDPEGETAEDCWICDRYAVLQINVEGSTHVSSIDCIN